MIELDGACKTDELLVDAVKLRLVAPPGRLAPLVVEEDESENGRADEAVMLPDDPALRPLREAGYLRKPVK